MGTNTKSDKALLPSKVRAELIDRMSVKTMRYVHSIPTKEAEGLAARVYDMLAEDAFINGSVTSHSKVPELMAGMWTGGREAILVSDRLERTAKEAMSATLSQVNQCPYCADMLISLVHSNGEHDLASQILVKDEENLEDPIMRDRLAWVKEVATAEPDALPPPPFTADELPEAIGCLFVFGYINRFSHVVMDGSPVGAPFGLQSVKGAALRMFGFELRPTTARVLDAGRALDLLPPASLPEDFAWALANPRVADALARWAAAIERETPEAVDPEVRQFVETNIKEWDGGLMPISRSWVESELGHLSGRDRAVAKLALVVAKASYQVDDKLVEDVLSNDRDEEYLIRVLAWASHIAARRIASRYYRSFQA